MPDNLRQAVLSAKKIKAHGAKKRQLQFIGVFMRKIDITLINEALYEIDRRRGAKVLEFHMIETWRDDLINGDDSPISEIMEKYPVADRQRLCQLVRNAKKELKENKPPQSFKGAFQVHKKMAEANG
jgi:ribosome-associated protein